MFKGQSKYLLFVTIIVLLFCVVQVGASEKSRFEEIKSEGVVVIGIANEKPASYVDDKGELAGYTFEIAKSIFNRLGIKKIEYVITEFGSLIPGLLAGRFDIVVAGMWITPERAKQVIFSDPHAASGDALVVKAGNPHDLHSLQDIIDKGLTASAEPGGIPYSNLVKLGMPMSRIITVTERASGIATVISGRADVFITASGTAIEIAKNYPDVEHALPFEDAVIDGRIVKGCGASTFRPEDTDFRDAYDRELAAMRDSGELFMILLESGKERNLANHKVNGEWKWLTWEDLVK